MVPLIATTPTRSSRGSRRPVDLSDRPMRASPCTWMSPTDKRPKDDPETPLTPAQERQRARTVIGLYLVGAAIVAVALIIDGCFQ